MKKLIGAIIVGAGIGIGGKIADQIKLEDVISKLTAARDFVAQKAAEAAKEAKG